MAAACNDAATVRTLVEVHGARVPDAALTAAFGAGHFELVEMMAEARRPRFLRAVTEWGPIILPRAIFVGVAAATATRMVASVWR